MQKNEDMFKLVKKFKKYSKPDDQLSEYVPSPRKPELKEKDWFDNLREHSGKSAGIQLNNKPTFSKLGKVVD